MKAAELRRSILQAAVEGKLVPQDPREEPASKLLERIRGEKERLVQEGKIKKTKQLPPVTEDEIPYELPEGWWWCRLGGVLQFADNKNIHREFPADKIINYVDIDSIDNQKFIIRSVKQLPVKKLSTRARRVLHKGDIVYSLVRPYLNNIAIVSEERADFIGSTGFSVFRPICISNRFIMYILLSPYIERYFYSLMSGFNSPSISQTDFVNTLIPLPPLAEQQRIVDQLDVLMRQCDELELAEKKLDKLDGRFAENLPKSILQSAVEGKLVPQDPREEPASKLLERIRGEKEWLVQEGKIKKTKPLPPIAEDEIPYELPEGWCWCRLGDVGKIIGGATPDSHNETYYTASGNGITWITPADMKYAKNNIIEYGAKDITQVGYNSCSTQMLPKGSVVFSSRAPIGHIAFAGKELCTNQGFKSIVPYGFSNNYWLFYVLKSKIPDIQSRASGTTFKEVSGQFMEKELIPLPPLAEQQRIVDKVDTLMGLCDALKAAYTDPVENHMDVKRSPFIPHEEEGMRLAARGDVMNLSKEAIQAMNDLFAEDEE